MTRLGIAATGVAALALAAALVGCTGEPSAEGAPEQSETPVATDESQGAPADSYVNFNSFVDEYQAAAEDLARTLPAGHEMLSSPPGDWDEDGQFEPGTGEMQAAFEWQCAWITAYVEATNNDNAVARSDALDSLEEWTNLPEVAPHTDDASKKIWAEQVIGPARAGEDTFLLEFASGCGS